MKYCLCWLCTALVFRPFPWCLAMWIISVGWERKAVRLCYAGCIIEVTNFFCIVMESSELRLLGGLCFLINKLFNLMQLFSGLCCKWYVCITRIKENSVTFMLYVKAEPTLKHGWEWFSEFYRAKPWVLHLSLQFYFEQVLRIPAAALLICNYPPLSPAWFSTVGLEEVVPNYLNVFRPCLHHSWQLFVYLLPKNPWWRIPQSP